jgi:hypothetical protein
MFALEAPKGELIHLAGVNVVTDPTAPIIGILYSMKSSSLNSQNGF